MIHAVYIPNCTLSAQIHPNPRPNILHDFQRHCIEIANIVGLDIYV